MATCEKCKKRDVCKEICPKLHKEISSHGISFRQKEKTYVVDMSYLADVKNPFNEFQKETSERLSCDERDNFFNEFDLTEAIDKVLSPREKLIIQLIIHGYTQDEIGQKLRIVKSRVNFLLGRAKAKIKEFYTRG